MKKSNYSKPSINDIQGHKKPDAEIRKKENLGYFFNKMEKICKNIQNHIREYNAQEKHFQTMQSYHDFEIICVNDGSTDNTKFVLESLKSLETPTPKNGEEKVCNQESRAEYSSGFTF